jgi:predicted nucleic acid-binding protein
MIRVVLDTNVLVSAVHLAKRAERPAFRSHYQQAAPALSD